MVTPAQADTLHRRLVEEWRKTPEGQATLAGIWTQEQIKKMMPDTPTIQLRVSNNFGPPVYRPQT